jgi:hypothetical protein
MKHFIIYKTTNTLDGKHYIGAHQTNNLDDGYMGSGKHLQRAIKKYSKEHFTVEILHNFDDKELMFAKEREIVNEHFVNNANTYNLKIGGSGGNPGIVGAFTGHKHSNEAKEKIRQAALKKTNSTETRQKLSDNSWTKTRPEEARAHLSKIAKLPKSEETKAKIREARKLQTNNNGGRKPAMNKDLLYEHVSKYGLKGAAEKLNLTYPQCRDRYYRFKAKEK